jgi:hypothetical protein
MAQIDIWGELNDYEEFLERLNKTHGKWINKNLENLDRMDDYLATSFHLLFLQIVYLLLTIVWFLYSWPRGGGIVFGGIIPAVLWLIPVLVYERGVPYDLIQN